MDWDKLRIFYSVAQSKSLTKAGETLNLSQSAVSRQISALEDKLGIPLFHRHARGLMLTEQGEILFRTVSDMVTKLQTTENALLESTAKPKGPFRITAPVDMGVQWLTPVMKEFAELYPDIDVTLLLEDRELDLTMREADVAIRMSPARQPDLIQKNLSSLRNAIYASNDYLRQHGIPKKLEELEQHRLVLFTPSPNLPFPDVNWLQELAEKKKLRLKPALKVNSLTALRSAVKSGMGIGALPEYMMHRTRHVSRILDDVASPVTEAYFVYPMEMKSSTRVAVFRNFIARKMAEYNF